MQIMMFTGRLAADPQITEDAAKAVFRLIEKRGVDGTGKDRLVGVNCVSWARGLNAKVIAPGLRKGCETLVIGAFVDTTYTSRDGTERTAKELVIDRLTVLDWADGRDTPPQTVPANTLADTDDEAGSAGTGSSPSPGHGPGTRRPRRAAA